MEAFISRFPGCDGLVATKVAVKATAIFGYVTDKKIAALSSDFDLIIMGTRREHPIMDRIFGSVASGVAQKAHCPVLLVPKGAHFSEFKRIIYASNWESANETLIERIHEWANLFPASIDFVHIHSDYAIKGFDSVKQGILEKLIDAQRPDFTYSFANITDPSALRGISRYAQNNQADLIVLANRQRSFFENLLGMSLTKELAMHIRIPLLVFHYDAWTNLVEE